jgi:serine/threonine protein kinase
MAKLNSRRLGQFEIVALIGEGGMAGVYRARHVQSQREVAVKVIKPHLIDKTQFLQRFSLEAQIMASLRHAHVVRLFDYGQADNAVYLVMELLNGGSLGRIMRRGPMPIDTANRVLEQVGSALDYAHECGIIHRDVKPQNILLDEAGQAHLTDFGLAKVLAESTVLSHSGAVLGTPAYMSPEQ